MTQKKPERMAWVVLLGAFAVFLLLCATVPLGIRYYLRHATSSKTATLEVIGGTPRYHPPGAAAPIAATKTVQLPEGTTVETDENSRGILTFLDGSTAILFPSTQITLREMNVPTFPWGIEPITLIVEETRGRLRVGAASGVAQGNNPAPARTFIIRTPQVTVALAEGSYVVEVSADVSQVIANDGKADVTAQDRTVTITRRQRTLSTRGDPPLPPLPAEQDILVNGDFKDPLPRGWDDLRDTGSAAAIAPGSAKEIQLGDRQVLHIVRTNSGQTSAITGAVQTINKEVSDYRTMRVAADIRLHNQSLSGGGVLSSEYPVILRLRYRDQYGSEGEWVHGFYYQNDTNNPTSNGEQIQQDVWFPFESGNLFDLAVPRPFFITSLQIYASGWDYDAYVSGVRLIVE
ncbi:MAG: FecR domain-containing protein [Chloroflexota bacterium]|nr:FecR domain-containing protein [Chloroflexota bacterium]